jgi:lipoate-protein ligase B
MMLDDGDARDREAPLGDRRVRFHLLGRVGFSVCESLQQHVAEEVDCEPDGRVVVLMCEHPRLISVGQRGSRAHVRLPGEQLRARGLELRWVSRRGGCLLHGPGQLAIYILASLPFQGWTPERFVARIQCGMRDLLAEVGVRCRGVAGDDGLWGRTGQLVGVGLTVRETVSCGAVFLNVNPDMADYSRIDAVSPEKLPAGMKSTMSCLLAERSLPVKMSAVRAAAIRHLAAAFDCSDYCLFTGHPSLAALDEEPA